MISANAAIRAMRHAIVQSETMAQAAIAAIAANGSQRHHFGT